MSLPKKQSSEDIQPNMMCKKKLLIYIAVFLSASRKVVGDDADDTIKDVEDDTRIVFPEFLVDFDKEEPYEVDPANPRSMPPIPSPSDVVVVVWICFAIVVLTFVLAMVVVMVILMVDKVTLRTRTRQSGGVEQV